MRFVLPVVAALGDSEMQSVDLIMDVAGAVLEDPDGRGTGISGCLFSIELISIALAVCPSTCVCRCATEFL